MSSLQDIKAVEMQSNNLVWSLLSLFLFYIWVRRNTPRDGTLPFFFILHPGPETDTRGYALILSIKMSD